MEDGTGLAGVIPPLKEADYLTLYPTRLPCIIKFGIAGPLEVNGKIYNQPMAANKNLSEVEIANILNYIQSEWGDKSIFYSPEKIRNLLDTCI
jgi:mono/diheme cytochrome c family protein